MSLSFEERKQIILEKLSREGKVKVSDLSEALNVSSETIRRDLERLDKEGKLRKVYGGAVKAGYLDSWEPPFDQKRQINLREKRAIGKLAASLVKDGDKIMIGTGTTPLEIVRFLAGKKNVTLITHSIPVMSYSMEVFDGPIIFIGGEVFVDQKFTNGPLADWTLQHLKADKAFISAGGVSVEDGVSDYDLYQASISRKMVERAEEVIVLADHTKFGRTTFAHICPLEQVSVIISDNNCPEEWKHEIAEKGIQILIANVGHRDIGD